MYLFSCIWQMWGQLPACLPASLCFVSSACSCSCCCCCCGCIWQPPGRRRTICLQYVQCVCACVCMLCIFRDAFSIAITQNESQQLNFGSAGRQRRRREEGHRECLIICLRYFLIWSAKYRSQRQTQTCGLSSDNNSWHHQQGEMLPKETEWEKENETCLHF